MFNYIFYFLFFFSHENNNIFVSTFFQLLVGADYNAGWAPTTLEPETYRSLVAHHSLLDEYYTNNGHCYSLKATR